MIWLCKSWRLPIISEINIGRWVILKLRKILLTSATLAVASFLYSDSVTANNRSEVFVLETYSQHPISKSDVAEFDFDEAKEKGIADISGLNLKSNADNIKLKIVD